MSRGRRLAVAAGVLVGAYLLAQIVPVVAAFAYAGTWPPTTVVEANSMMHVDEDEYVNNHGETRADGVPYGRIGTLDPGDLVIVKDETDPSTIETYAEGADEEHGNPGEVVVYFPGGDERRTPIIHRAMTYVEHLGDTDDDGDTNYEIRWHEDWDRDVGCEDGTDRNCTQPGDCNREDDRLVCRFDGGFRLPALMRGSGRHVYQPDGSGFITQGDNPMNRQPDQPLFDRGPVKAEWLDGVAKVELPWIGLGKLATTGDPAKTGEVRDHPYYWTVGSMTAARDLWIGALTATVLWWGAWLGAAYLAYRYVRYDTLPWRDDGEDEADQATTFQPADP